MTAVDRVEVDHGTLVQLEVPGIFFGRAGCQGRMLAFQAQQRAREGVVTATLDGEPCRLMLVRLPDQERATLPWLQATILSD